MQRILATTRDTRVTGPSDVQVRDQQPARFDVALVVRTALPLRTQRNPDRHDVDEEQLQDA